MDCGFIAEIQKHIKESHSFTVDIGKTVIYGLCENCKNKGKEE